MEVPLESICGVWIDKKDVKPGEIYRDRECGEKIAQFIRSNLGTTVVQADVENISFVQVRQITYFAFDLQCVEYCYSAYIKILCFELKNFLVNENLLCFQDAPTYVGYYAVISARSRRNHAFMVYLTSVLWRLYNLNLNSKIVLVVVDKKIFPNADESLKTQSLKTLKTHRLKEYLPINLRTLPMVIAPEINEDCLLQISAKLHGMTWFTFIFYK